jgi:dTDP-4-dehydrorhamnose 3,5-epimerase
MRVEPTSIPDVLLIHPKVFKDDRGYFFESWEAKKFAGAGIALPFVQDNQSKSTRHTLRGLHYQIQQPQGKLVRVVQGTVFDVAVDLRRSSATFGQWVGALLTDEHHEMLWVPPGFAHGFVVLSETAIFSYKCTDFYAPQHERAILWSDRELGIDWRLPAGATPTISAKDAVALSFTEAECFP